MRHIVQLHRGGSSGLIIRHSTLRGNINIRLDLNIQRMQIIPQELAITPLDLRVLHSRLHLHVLQIRRARTRLGQEVGVADIGVDVVGGRAAVGSVLQIEGGEQAADDGEVGAD